MLAEIGDDRSSFADGKGLKAYAGAAPITRGSGKSRSITRRHLKNNRLAGAGYIGAFSALTASPGARAHYDRRRDAGDRHAAAGSFVAALDGGEQTYYRVAELYFADQGGLEAGFASDEGGKATAADYQKIAPPGSRMFVEALDD